MLFSNAFHAVTLPCPANERTVSQPVIAWEAGYTESRAASHLISWTGTNLGAVFVPDINHIFLISFEMKQEYKNIPIYTNNNSFEFMRLFKFIGIGTYSLRSRSSISLQLMCPFCESCHNWHNDQLHSTDLQVSLIVLPGVLMTLIPYALAFYKLQTSFLVQCSRHICTQKDRRSHTLLDLYLYKAV